MYFIIVPDDGYIIAENHALSFSFRVGFDN